MRILALYELESDRKISTLALTLLRVAVGGLMMVHGYMKLADISGTIANFTSLGIPAPELSAYLAILGEFFGGLGLALGALTPLAALGPVLVMAGAIYFVHRDNGPLAMNGGWELPLTFLLVSVYFMAHGPGPISVDAAVTRHRLRSRNRRRHVTVPTGA